MEQEAIPYLFNSLPDSIFSNMKDVNILQYFKSTTLVIGYKDVQRNLITMLGTGFLVGKDLVVTTKHVISSYTTNLSVIVENGNKYNDYQDVTSTTCTSLSAEMIGENPFADIAILRIQGDYSGKLISLGSLDEVSVFDTLWIFGFPHCVEGRKVFTMQQAELGAKILLNSNGIKSKYSVLNIQSRPGQSGSVVYSPRKRKIIGMLVGAYAIDSGISLGGINPRELNQTTECVSAEYISEMLPEQGK